MKSPPMMTAPIGGTPLMTPVLSGGGGGESFEFCGVKSPVGLVGNGMDEFRKDMGLPRVDFELKIYFPKKFEALRRFFCGS